MPPPQGQMPPGASIPVPGLPGGMPGQQMPTTLPPSSGGYNPNFNPGYQGGYQPNQGQPQMQPQQMPPQNSQPGGQAGRPNGSSEVVPFKPKKEVTSTLVVKTSEGEFKITFKPDIAPRNVENFVELALGQKEFTDIRTGKKVKRPFYTGLNCHRVIKSVLIQCGCPFGNGKGGPGYRVQDERSSGMKFDRPGVVAMALARTSGDKGVGYEPNSAGSQFFITLGPLPDYNDQFTVIGHVTSGMDTIRKIASTPTGPTDRPLKRVIIFSIDPDLPPLPPGGPSAADPMAAPQEPDTTVIDPLAAPGAGPAAPPALPPPGGAIDPFAMPPPPTNP